MRSRSASCSQGPGLAPAEAASVPEDVDGPIPGEVLADCTERRRRLLPEGSDVESEDFVEAPIAEVRVLQRDGLEHGPARVEGRRRFLRVAISIILGERSIAVIVPVVSLSQTRALATPWPQPTLSRRSAGRTSRVSTAQTNRSDAFPAMPQQ